MSNEVKITPPDFVFNIRFEIRIRIQRTQYPFVIVRTEKIISPRLYAAALFMRSQNIDDRGYAERSLSI